MLAPTHSYSTSSRGDLATQMNFQFSELITKPTEVLGMAMCGEVWAHRSHLAVPRLDVPPFRDQNHQTLLSRPVWKL